MTFAVKVTFEHIFKFSLLIFWLHLQEEATRDDILKDVEDCPDVVAVIVGNPHVPSVFYIFGEGSILTENTGTVLDALILTFALHYICNVEYTKKAKYTYLFFQHVVLDICNDGGSRPVKLINFVKRLSL